MILEFSVFVGEYMNQKILDSDLFFSFYCGGGKGIWKQGEKGVQQTISKNEMSSQLHFYSISF